MSEYRFFAYSDFEFLNSNSSNALNIPLDLYSAVKRTKTEELSTDLNIPYTVFEILVAVFAIIGNSMVIIVFQQERKLRRRTNYYIVSLAIADLLVGLLGVPFAILASVGLPTNLHACLFTVSLLVVLCTISIFCLVAVSVDRYWAILHPMAYSRNVRTKTAIGIISMCWIAGSIVGFLPLFGWHAGVSENQACLFVKVMDYDYLVFLYFATIITPALLLLAFYTHIYRVIIRQVRQIVTMKPLGDSSRRSSVSHVQVSPNHPTGGTMLRVLGAARKRDVKATQNLSIIVLFFMICWIPLYTINCVKAFCPECFVHPKLTFFCIILSHLNSAVNPVLYAYHLKDFRAALKNLILKMLGFEVEQRSDLHYRVSLASQQRLQSLMEKRSSLQNRIYIDSPVWLRQQALQQQKQDKTSTISSSLNMVHQTVAAVASATADVKRDMWKIVEVPSTIDENSKSFPEVSVNDNSNDTRHCSTSGNKFCNENIDFEKDFSSSSNEFCDTGIGAYNNRDHNDHIYLPEKLHSDSGQYEVHNCGIFKCDDGDVFSASIHLPQRSITLSSSSSSSIDNHNEYLQKYNPSCESLQHENHPKLQNSLRHCGSYSNSLFVIENFYNSIAPNYGMEFKTSSTEQASKSLKNRMTRSCSCTNEAQLMCMTSRRNDDIPKPDNNSGNDIKLSPLRMVSNLILSPVKHSSLFHILDVHKREKCREDFKRKSISSDS